MAPRLDWKKLMKLDLDALPQEDKVAHKLLETISKVDGKELQSKTPEELIHLFKLTQSLMKMKTQEVELAAEELEKAVEHQAKCEKEYKTKVRKLQQELELARRSAGGHDTRFLRDEIHHLEEQLEQKELQLADMEKELEKQKKMNEQNEQLREDVGDSQRQTDSQKETALLRRGEDSSYLSQLSRKNLEISQYLDEIQNLTEANEKLDIENEEMRKNLEESVQEMEKMTDEYNKMKCILQQSDTSMDQLRKENEQYKLQIQELSEQLKAKNEEDDPLMAALDAKVEEWKEIFASKDAQILEYQQMLFDLNEKLKVAQLNEEKSSVLALQQAVEERDAQIRLLTEQMEQYTKEMEHNTILLENVKSHLQSGKGCSSLAQQNHIEDMQEKLKELEERTKKAEKSAEIAEAEASEKDKELVETRKRMRDYERGIYGLEEAVVEIKDLNQKVKVREREIENLVQDVNKLELKINDFLDENEELRERLGLDPKTMINLKELRNSKVLRQEQYRLQNQILLQEIERLEEERIELKKKVRKLAQEKGRTAAIEDREGKKCPREMSQVKTLESGVENGQEEHSGQMDSVEDLVERLRRELAPLRSQNEYLANELNVRERDLEKNKTVIAQFQSKVKELSEEKKQLEEGMKEILQAVKEMQNDPSVKGGETALTIPSLDRLVNAMECKTSEGTFDVNVHWRAQVDQLTGRNEELRQELKRTQEAAANFSHQLANANEKIAQLNSEICSLRHSEGASVVIRTMSLPEGMVPSSVTVINSLNESLLHLLQELENKEELLKKLEEAVEDYRRKFAVIRHQQGLLYKEYQREKESWQNESENMKKEKKKLEEQKEEDATKIKAYSNLLSALQMDPDETKKVLAENHRKITVLQVNERSLRRQCSALLETERHLRKENEKLRGEITDMETAVMGKIGNLQRWKEMASFKIAALQKLLDHSVLMSELELANKQYNALTAKYRDMLQKDNLLVQRTTNMEHMERENESLKAQINVLSKELEMTKEKLHIAEQAWEQITKLGGDNAMDKAPKAITNGEILSISKKITMLEMKELNERQRAEHSQRMSDHLRNTLKQIEERNLELETKFAELTKINLEAQKVEEELRDELSKSVSKAVSDADRQQIMDLEKHEMELKTEVSKLRELSDVARMQVEALEARQQYRDKEVESLRMQILDYQAQSDEKAVIAKLHQHILALQGSESAAAGKLETLKSKLQKMEIQNLRLEQKLDEREKALYFARLEGRNRARYLQQTVQSLRRQFSGALPLAQQEKFTQTMIQLQHDKLKILEEVQRAQQERQSAENRALEMDLKLKSLEELVSVLKDRRGAQKVIDWHLKLEALHREELKLHREVVEQKEEVKYLRNIISVHECTIRNLEEELVQQNKFHEERQMAWDQREVELQRQLDLYDHQQKEPVSSALRSEEETGSVPDHSLPLPQQLELALRKIQEHVRTLAETRTTCKSLEEKLKEKETALCKAEENVLSRDKVINELRLQLHPASEREKIVPDLGKQEGDPACHRVMKIARQVVENMQQRLNHKEEVIKKYERWLAKAREEQEEMANKHEEDLRALHQKLYLHTDNSLNKFKETALEIVKRNSLSVSYKKLFLRFAEMRRTVAEQDNALALLVGKLKKTASDLEKQKEITAMKVKEFESLRAQLQDQYRVDREELKDEANKLRNKLAQMEMELATAKAELRAQREANRKAPTATVKQMLENLKSQLAMKEKQQKALSQAILELRAEMTVNAEQQIISAASQKEANMNVQEIVDRQTKGLMTQVEELKNHITKLTDSLKISKAKETSLSDEMNELTQELEKKQRAFAKILTEKKEMEKENEELKKRIRRLSGAIQSKADGQNLIEALQKKIKKLESELEKTREEIGKKGVREDKTSTEEMMKWEKGKKWQLRVEGLQNKLREKEKEADALGKQLNVLKEIYIKTEKEKVVLQKKLKISAASVDHVVGARDSETDKELEELRKRNLDLENEVAHLRTQQAISGDSVVEELNFKNQYLQEQFHALQRQHARETYSRPSTSGIGSDDQYRREQEVLKENLRLSSENVELRFQLEQANKDLPRLKNQIGDLKEMCDLLRKERAEVERKLDGFRGAGRGGKTVPELEKTIDVLKKIVERVQRENEELKKVPAVISNEKLLGLEQENEKLKSELERTKLHLAGQLSTHSESKAKGMGKVISENERLRKELRKEADSAEKLRIAKNNLEILNEKLTVQLEENIRKLKLAESKFDEAEGKRWKPPVMRVHEAQMKEMEMEIAKKSQSIADLKQLLQEATEREHKADKNLKALKEQVELLKHFPEGTRTEKSLFRELQLLRLANDQLEKEKAQLAHQVEDYKRRRNTDTSEGPAAGHNEIAGKDKNDKLMTEVADLKAQLKASELEKQQIKEEIKELRR
ncbi:centrosomal protein of 290 kDa [Porphyrio hochstetteri]